MRTIIAIVAFGLLLAVAPAYAGQGHSGAGLNLGSHIGMGDVNRARERGPEAQAKLGAILEDKIAKFEGLAADQLAKGHEKKAAHKQSKADFFDRLLDALFE